MTASRWRDVIRLLYGGNLCHSKTGYAQGQHFNI